jgi:putative transposase
VSDRGLEARQFGHRARPALNPAEGEADTRERGRRHPPGLPGDFLAVLPAQAAQAVLKTYFQEWRNCWDGRAHAPNFKGW